MISVDSLINDDEMFVIPVRNPRAIRLPNGQVYLKVGRNIFLEIGDDELASTAHELTAAALDQFADLAVDPVRNSALCKQLLADAPTARPEPEAVAVVVDRAKGEVAYGIQFTGKMPVVFRLESQAALDMAKLTILAYAN
jgi:hypothetical protein